MKKLTAFLVLLPLCFSSCLSLLTELLRPDVDFGSFQDDPVYRDKLVGIWVLDTSESGDYDTLEFRIDGTCSVVWYKDNKVVQTWATRYKVSNFQIVFSFDQKNDVRRANYVIINNNTLSLTNWSNNSPNETYHKSGVVQSEIVRNEIESALIKASDTVISTLQKEAIIAIINISSDDNEVSEFIAGELEYILVNKGFNVVDRSELDRIRQEQNFQLSGVVDDNSAVSMGKFTGANIVITGAISGSGNMRRLRLRALDIQTAMVVGSASEALPDRTSSRQSPATTSSENLNRVYVAGFYENNRAKQTACYWVDGVRTDLPVPGETESSAASAIVVSDGKVYAAGEYLIRVGNYSSYTRACYWVDGVRTDLPVPGETENSTASAIAVSGGKVYVSGYHGWNTYDRGCGTACYWVDGVRTDLPLPPSPTYREYSDPIATAIIVSGGKVYVSGSYSSGGNTGLDFRNACYWVDGVITNLSDDNIYYAIASAIAVSGGKVYVTGCHYDYYVIYSACYWVDGVRTDLSVPGGIESYIASAIAVSGGKVYVSGYHRVNNGSTSYTACYWIDGVITDLPGPYNGNSSATAIAVSGGKVYVSGYHGNTYDRGTACYWVDEVRTDLPSPFKASAIAIAVEG